MSQHPRLVFPTLKQEDPYDTRSIRLCLVGVVPCGSRSGGHKWNVTPLNVRTLDFEAKSRTSRLAGIFLAHGNRSTLFL